MIFLWAITGTGLAASVVTDTKPRWRWMPPLLRVLCAGLRRRRGTRPANGSDWVGATGYVLSHNPRERETDHAQ